jgi:hypothetical protein
VLLQGSAGLFNDFYIYWAAASILNAGGDPYDLPRLVATLDAAGVHILPGTGYSYPVLFAELVRPLALVAPEPAALIFTALSLVGLAIGISLLVGGLETPGWPAVLIAGLGGGLLEPVTGTLYFGQANLFVLPVLALAWRGVAPGAAVAVATAVKLYPVTALLALLAQGRRQVRELAAAVGLMILLILLPLALRPRDRFFGHSVGLLGPDEFWSNQSVNGFVSRLAIPSASAQPPFPGLAVTPVMVLFVLLLLALTIVVLWRAHGEPFHACFALALWFGIVAAPRNSLWNFAPILVCFASGWKLARDRPRLLVLLCAAAVLLEVQGEANVLRDWIYGSSPTLVLLASCGLYGALLLGAVLARELLVPSPPPRLTRPNLSASLQEERDHQVPV